MNHATIAKFRTDRAAVERDPFPANLGQYIDQSAERFGDRPLWRSIDGDQTLTFREFQSATLKCATGLRAMEIGRGTHVGLMLPNIPAFFITWIALSRLGAVAVMINTGSTGRELAVALSDADVTTLVIGSEFLDRLQDIPLNDRPAGLRILVEGRVSSDFPSLASTMDHPEMTDFSAIDAEEISTIQFTSGSSGLPKGCMLTHLYWMMIGRVRATAGPAPSRMLIDTPFHYMGPLWRFMMALYVGATIFVAKRYSLSQLLKRIIDHRIEFALVTGPVAKLPDDPQFQKTNLLWLTTYGLSKDLHEGLERRFGVPVREVYGMTEIGAGFFMPIEDGHMVGSGSCGKPAPFRSFRIVQDGRDVEAEEAGELWVSGPGIFKGYYKREQATAEAFEGQWFKTGDLAKRDRDGYYYIIGRIKDVIRRSGENISASEVEMVVNGIPGVLESGALAVPSDLRGEEVKIYVVVAPGTDTKDVAPDVIVAHCRARLAPFKVPRYIEYIEEMPHTSTGKINKNVLKTAKVDLRAGSYDVTDIVWR